MNPFDFGDDIHIASHNDQSFYADNGYFVAENLFTAAECNAINTRAERHAEADFSAVHNLHREDPAFLAVMRFPRVVSLLESLRPQTLIGLDVQMFFKKTGTPYAAQSWSPHQDNSYVQNPNNLYITTNLFLTDADPDNGGLYLYPGSHKAGLLACVSATSYREAPGTQPGNTVTDIPSEYNRIEMHVRQGDLLVMNGCLIHGSYPNKSSTRSRPLLSCTYLPAGEKFLPGRTAKRETVNLHSGVATGQVHKSRNPMTWSTK